MYVVRKLFLIGQQAIYTLLPSTHCCWKNYHFLKHLQRIKTDENPMEQSLGCMLDILRSQMLLMECFNGVGKWTVMQQYHTLTDFLGIIHHPNFHINVSWIGLCFCPWVRSLLYWAQWIKASPYLKTEASSLNWTEQSWDFTWGWWHGPDSETLF